MKSFTITFVLFLVLDFIWIGFVMKKFNMAQLAEIGRIENGSFDVMIVPALIAYVLMSLMITQFVLPRLPADASILHTFLVGALAGLVVYGIYDMTNLAILRGYPMAFAAVDMAWGTFVFGAVAVLVKKFAAE